MGKNGETSSEKEKEKEKKKILVHTRNIEEGGFTFGEFFTIDLSNGEMKELPYVLYGGDHGLNSMVSIGSTLYVVGGLLPIHAKERSVKPPNSRTDTKKGMLYHHGMSFIDLNSPDSGWKSAPCFLDTPEYYSASVSLGGKIYSFAQPDYAGIFDPVSQQWEKLLPPSEPGSFQINSRTEIIADPHNNRILVFFAQPDAAYFAYYPDHKRWEPWDPVPTVPRSHKPVLFADGGLFFMYVPKHPRVFRVYDTVAKEWLNVGFKEHFSMWTYKFDAMVYLGNHVICLLGQFTTYDDNFNSLDVNNLTLCKFTFVRSPTQLLFTSFPVQTYTLDSPCLALGYLPI